MLRSPPGHNAPALLALACALCAVYYFATPAGIFGSKAQGDGYLGFHQLPALLLHHTVDMRPTHPRAAELFDRAQGGRRANRNPLGPALALLPIYTATVLVEVVARSVAPDAPGLRGPPYAVNELQTFWSGLGTLAAGLAGLALLFRFLRRRLGERAALWGALAALSTTPLFWYLTTQPHYQHGLAFAAVTLLLCTWADSAPQGLSVARFARLGALAGLAMLLRPQEVVALLLPASELLAALVVALRRGPVARVMAALRCGAALTAGALLSFLPQLLTWASHFGPLRRPPTIEGLRLDAPALLEVLFSTRCGLFPWTPVAYLALPGLLLLLRRSAPLRAVGAATLLFVGADVLLVAWSWVWYGSFGFGCRRLSDCAPAFALGVAALVARTQTRPWLQRAVAGALVLCAVLNLGLVEVLRRRALPSSGAAARPAFRAAQALHAPAPVVRALRHGWPFVQPVGWLFALWHRAPATAWEGVVGNYALERDAHDLSVSGDRFDLRAPEAADFAIAGLGARDDQTQDLGRSIAGPLRLLLQPFAKETISGELTGVLPPGAVRLTWDGAALDLQRPAEAEVVLRFQIPRALVRAHRVGELTLSAPAGTRLRELRLYSLTRWWRGETEPVGPAGTPTLELPSR